MGTTPTYAIPYPDPTDPADVPADMQATALATRAVLSAFKTDTDADLGDMEDQISGALGAFTQLGHTVLPADAATIDFDAIPASYQHLVVMAALRSTAGTGASNAVLRLDHVLTATYSGSYMRAFNPPSGGTQINALSALLGVMPGATSAAAAMAGTVIFLPNYVSNKAKAYLSLMFARTGAGSTAADQQLYIAGGTLPTRP